MSARLRNAVRTLLREIETEGAVEAETLTDIRASLQISENYRRGRVYTPTQGQLAALIEALQQFKRHDSPHFAGCPAARTGGACSRPCALARAALEPDLVTVTAGIVAMLRDEITAQQRELHRVLTAHREERKYFRAVLLKARAETGFQMRGPGRPRKSPAVHEGRRPEAVARDTARPGL